MCFWNLSLPQGRQFLVATNQQSVTESPLQYRTLKNALVKRYDNITLNHVLFKCNAGLRSTFAGNIALLPSDVIDFAMLPAQRLLAGNSFTEKRKNPLKFLPVATRQTFPCKYTFLTDSNASLWVFSSVNHETFLENYLAKINNIFPAPKRLLTKIAPKNVF